MEGFSQVSFLHRPSPVLGIFLQGDVEQEIIQQLPTYTVTRVDSVSRPPPLPDATQTLGPKLGAAVLGACNHSSLAWYVESASI